MFARMLANMTSLSDQPFELDDQAIDEASPRVRAWTLQRLELIWKQVELNLDPELGADPRWAEIGLRVLDRESRLYRLDKPAKVPDEDENEWVGVDRGELLLKQLAGVEARLRSDLGQNGTEG